MAGYKVGIASETKAFKQGVEIGIIEPLEDAQKELKELGKGKGLDQLEAQFKGTQNASDDLEASIKENARAIERSFKNAYKGVKDDSDDATRKMKDGFQEAKEEANSSGKEAAASFGGGFEDVADFVQETLANALAGFGPIGAAAGIALAAVLGTVLANATQAQEKLNEAREAARDLAQEMYENGGKLPLETAIDNLFDKLSQEIKPNGPIQSMLDQFVDFGSRIDAVKKSATDLGLPMSNIAKALSGTDMRETDRVLEAVTKRLDELKSNVSTGWVWETGPLEDMKTQLEITKKAAEDADQASKLVGSSFDSQAYRDQIREIGDAWRDNAKDAADYISEQDGVTSFDWSKYLTDAEATLAAANEYKRKIVTLPSDIATEAESIFAEQGAIAANSYVTAYESASGADKARFIAAAQANGQAAGDAGGKALVDAANSRASGWIPPELKLKLRVDDSDVQNYRPPTKTGNVRYLPQAV